MFKEGAHTIYCWYKVKVVTGVLPVGGLPRHVFGLDDLCLWWHEGKVER